MFKKSKVFEMYKEQLLWNRIEVESLFPQFHRVDAE